MKRNIINKTKAYLAAALSCLIASSCTSGFESFNTDPNGAQEIDLRTLITTMEMDAVIPCSDEGANQFQRACNLIGDAYAGYLSPIQAFNAGSYTCTYALNATDFNNVAFSVAFTNVMPAWLKLKYAHDSGLVSDDTFAVAEVLKVMTLQRTTDIYGSLPVLKFGETETPYDSQEAIYKKLFEDLDAAIAVLKDYAANASNDKPLLKVDAVYSGDYTNWLRLANSVKLRMAMRIVYVEPELAQSYAEQAVKDGVMELSDHSAQLKTTGAIQIFNPLEEVWNAYEDTRMGATIDAYMNGYADPRLAKYFQPCDDKAYHGLRSGLKSMTKADYTTLSVPNVAKDTPVRWMMASEVAFLRAEGALRKWAMGGTADSFYKNGIELSFLENGLSASAAATYAASTNTPTAFADVSKASSKYDAPAPSQIPVAWDEGAGMEPKLERIITQKWIAMYPNGQEAWSEFRRTGYPKVIKVVDNMSNGDVDTGEQIRRMTFPRSEYSNNAGALNRAIRLLGGPDKGSTKLWWDKK